MREPTMGGDCVWTSAGAAFCALGAQVSQPLSRAVGKLTQTLHDPAADAILYMCTAIEWKILRHSVH